MFFTNLFLCFSSFRRLTVSEHTLLVQQQIVPGVRTVSMYVLSDSDSAVCVFVSALSWGCPSALTRCSGGCQRTWRRKWPCRENSLWLLLHSYPCWPRSSAWPKNIYRSSTTAGEPITVDVSNPFHKRLPLLIFLRFLWKILTDFNSNFVSAAFTNEL